jgi:hypothetical protein
MPESSQQVIDRPVSEQKKSLVEQLETLEISNKASTLTNIDIPETSEKSPNFPVLLPLNQSKPSMKTEEETFAQSPTATSSFSSVPTPLPKRGYFGPEEQLSSAPITNTTLYPEIGPQIDLTQIKPGAANGASRAIDIVEQLRNATHELATKKTPQREQTRNESSIQQLSPSPQQVVIVKQPATPPSPSIPYAFWERCYLGRARIRLLR